MSKKIVEKTLKASCSKCEREVTFRYHELQISDDQVGIIKTVLDRVTHYGKCLVAEKSRNPGTPGPGEMDDCPLYQELSTK
jgi:hypothetical protein